MGRHVAVHANRARTAAVLAAVAIAVGIAACDRPDRSAATKPELMPTAPAIAPPPANPAPVMPPKADTVLGTPPQAAAAPSADSAATQQPAARTAQGSDPNAKEPMTKEEESAAMPKPAQANDHSTTATDAKR